VARSREHGLEKQGKDDITPRTRKGRKDGEILWKSPEYNSGINDRRLRQQPRRRMRIRDIYGGPTLYLRKERATTNGIEGWSARQRSHLEIEGRLNKNLYEIFRGSIAGQVVGSPSGLRRIRNWTLWRERPPPKRKKKLGPPVTPEL
jgi:hypothetical protein